MGNKKYSIQDIAREMKVSVSTISAVINGKAAERRISSDLTAQILAYTKQINYQPNLLARSLRTGKTNIIGVLVEDISDPFFSAVAKRLEVCANKLNYKILFSSTENKKSIAEDSINAFLERQVDFFIMAPPPKMESKIQEMLTSGQKFILFDRYFKNIDTNNVIIDNYNGTRSAMDLFLRKKKKNIALITIESNQSQMIDRQNAYKDVIKETNSKEYILSLKYDLKALPAIKEIKEFILNNKQIDAILFTTNYLTAYGVKAIKELKIPVPDQLAIIGYDDNLNFELMSPTITTVAQPVDLIAENIFSLFKSMQKDDSMKKPTTVIVKTELKLRESV